MQWLEATVKTKSEEIDEICSVIQDVGVQGVSIEDENDLKAFLEQNRQYWDYVDESLSRRFEGLSQVKFYLIDDEQGHTALRELQGRLTREITVRTIKDEDWGSTWRNAYEPIPVGNRLMIVPEWLDPDLDGRRALRLEPGLAFGTGSHATTRMCLELLDRIPLEKKKVLDLGFGSGILGIGALVLGCSTVTGCDVDPNAPAAARRNAALNGITEEQFKVCAGILKDEGVRQYLGTGFDLVLANIVADVILPLTKFVRRFMAPGASYICSGIIDNRAAEVETELERNGFVIMDHLQEEEWHCFQCQ